MNIIKRLFSRHKLKDIFTPTTIAKLAYVNRNNIEKDLEKYLNIPGKQIIIYGHSGSGKTTLLRNKLKDIKQNFVKTHCESNTTFNDLLLQAFDDLNRFYISEKSSNKQYTINSETKAEYAVISTKISNTVSESQGDKRVRVVPPQLTPQKLAKFLGEINAVWIIEDFHKVVHDEKKRIADVVKIFIDNANDYNTVRIICIGAVGTARELIELDNNLNNRVAELNVPLLSDNEIDEIITKGFDLLNIKIEKELRDKIIYYSNNLASITHQLCYDLCYDSKIFKNRYFPKTLKKDAFKEAINAYVRKNSDTFTKIYDAILCQTYGWNVLKAFEHLEKEYLTFEEIRSSIPSQKRPTEEELINYLEQLGSSEYKEVVRLDRASKKYSISSPFFKAFLKMKFAIEKSEQKNIKNKKNNKLFNKYSIDENINERKIIFDEQFFIEFNKILDNLVITESRIKNENIVHPLKGKSNRK